MSLDTSDAVQQIRSFNRIVTRHVGALDEEYLERGRSLGAARLLWEIGRDGCDVALLRERLGLDSGYLSRLLRGLEDEALVTVNAADADRRARTATLTADGHREWEAYDRLSNEQAERLLDALDQRSTVELLEAMATVERLLTSTLVRVDIEDPRSAVAHHCLGSYYAEIDDRFDTGFDPAKGISSLPDELTLPKGLLLVARIIDRPIGCGALKFADGEPPHIKRMWVDPRARGMGVGRRILSELERHAAEHGARSVRLDTQQTLHEAKALYASAGYEEVEPFNDEFYADHWFEKTLESSP